MDVRLRPPYNQRINHLGVNHLVPLDCKYNPIDLPRQAIRGDFSLNLRDLLGLAGGQIQ
jgi:hypothetical protein